MFTTILYRFLKLDLFCVWSRYWSIVSFLLLSLCLLLHSVSPSPLLPVVFHPSILLWFFFLLCLFFSPKMSFQWPSHPAFTSLYSYTCPSSFFFIYSPHFPSNPHLSSLLLLPFMLFPVNFNLTCFSASISLAFPPCLPVLACCVRQWQRRRLCVKMATKKTR